MSKLFGYGEGLEAKTTRILQNCEKLMDTSMKLAGGSTMDILKGLDAETGAMIGGAMAMFKDATDLAIAQAKAMDKMIEDLDYLKDMNKSLSKENEELRRLLQELGRKLDKLTKKD